MAGIKELCAIGIKGNDNQNCSRVYLLEKGTLMDKEQKQKTNMKGIIRILIVALAVAGADVNGWMAMAQEKQISGMEQGAQKTPDHNDILRSCKELRRSGEF